MPDVRFDRYYRYGDLTTILQSFAEEDSDLVKLESIGQSLEGGDICVATVTNTQSAEAEAKPLPTPCTP